MADEAKTTAGDHFADTSKMVQQTAGMQLPDLLRTTARVMETQRPGRKWADYAAVDLRRAAREIERLHAVIRVNALRWNPSLTHAEIDEVIYER
jgi:hypothetical protein